MIGRSGEEDEVEEAVAVEEGNGDWEGESEESSDNTCPPLAEDKSCTTAPNVDSGSETVTCITGSMSTDGEALFAVRSACATAQRVAWLTAVGVVSGNIFSVSRSTCMLVEESGYDANGPRASAAEVPEWTEERRVGRERCAGR